MSDPTTDTGDQNVTTVDQEQNNVESNDSANPAGGSPSPTIASFLAYFGASALGTVALFAGWRLFASK